MNPEKAIRLIRDLVSAEVEVVKQANTGSGKLSKRVIAEEERAVERLFEALTGEEPSEAQIREMVDI